MRLLCSETNHNSSPAAAFTITPVVLKQFLLPQSLKGRAETSVASDHNSAPLLLFKRHIRSGLTPQGEAIRKEITLGETQYLSMQMHSRERMKEKRNSRVPFILSHYDPSTWLLIELLVTEWIIERIKCQKKMTSKCTKGIVSCAASERQKKKNLLKVL